MSCTRDRFGASPAQMPGRLALLACLACVIAVFGFALPASAHDARPLSINISEQSENLYVAYIRVPPIVPDRDLPKVKWPADCHVISDNLKHLVLEGRETTSINCEKGLEGQQITVVYPYFNPSLPTLFRLSELGGKTLTRVQPPDKLVWTVPKSPGPWSVAAGYLGLGVRHIWTGIDHLLFVTGLLILAGTTRRVLTAITGFTIAHSITLSLSALNIIVLPEPPVEAAIALSILFLAREIAFPSPNSLAGRYPILVSSSFGLLHGFGFAAALRAVGLPTKELAVGLFCFNCGVEIGQITFIIAILAIAFMARKAIMLGGWKRGLPPSLEGRLGLISGYGLGIPAAFWFVQRLMLF